MAVRPVFFGNEHEFSRKMIDFKYYNGFSIQQKQKSIDSLHREFLDLHPEYKVLEVSTKSTEELGVQCSAFNLMLTLNKGEKFSVEQVFQCSKVFKKQGHQLLLLQSMDSKSIKKRIQQINSEDELVGFRFFTKDFPLEPKTYFYNWLYINTLVQNKELSKAILEYDAFTDIEFNPNKSINCQAEACSIYISLVKKGKLEEALKSKEDFLEIVYGDFCKKKYNEKIYSEQLNLDI